MRTLNTLNTLALICSVTLGVASLSAHAGDDSMSPGDDSILAGMKFASNAMDERVDSTYPPAGKDVMDAAAGPLAFGGVYSDGSKQSGTTNWTSSYNSTYKRYEISITGESYYYLSYATVVTPAGDQRYCRSSSVSGKLLVYCYDYAGNTATSRFGFITFKPN